jgi:Secretion system C-terminal sorting domain
MKKIFTIFSLFMASFALFAQSTANYTFSTNTTGTLEDMTGSTLRLGANSNDNNTPTVPIGFDFIFMGTVYSQFSVTSNGSVGLGGTIASVHTITGGTLTVPVLSAFCADIKTGSDGKVHYKLVGTAPNRRLVIEYLNMMLFQVTASDPGTATFQTVLYEGTNVIEFIYGAMNVTSTAATNKSPSIGFYTGSATNSFVSVLYASNTANVTTPYAANPAVTSTGNITNLNSSSATTRRRYRFTPSPTAPNTPTWQSPTAVNASGMTLNWTDNATNEIGYIVQRSTDNVTFTNQGTVLAANTNTLVVTGLQFSTLYYWRVIAIREGVYSAAATGSATTTAPATYTWNGSTNTSWNTAANWTPNRTTPVAADVLTFNGTVTPNVTVSYDVATTQTVGKVQVINNANVTFNASATGKTLSIGGSVGTDFEVATGSSFTMGSNAPTVGFVGTSSNVATIDGTFSITTGIFSNGSCITTVNGTVNHTGGATISGTSVASLFFSAGANYNQSFSATSASQIPRATWNTTSNVTILAPVASTATSMGGVTGTFGNFTWNCVNQNANVNMDVTSASFSTFTMQASGATSFVGLISNSMGGNATIGTLNVTGGHLVVRQTLSGTTTITCTNFSQSGGIFDMTNATKDANTILDISNNFNRTGGTFTRSGAISAVDISSASHNGTYIRFNGTTAQTPTLGTLTGMVGLGFNNPAGVNLTATINDGANVWMTRGTITGTLTYTNSTLKNGIIYNGTTAQVAGSELPATIGRLTISNAAGLTINENLTLNQGNIGGLTLSSGVITMAANKTIALITSAALPSGSTSSFINLAAPGSAYEVTGNTTAAFGGSNTGNFPIGVGSIVGASGDFRGIILSTLRFNGTIKVQIVSGGGTAGTGIQTLPTARRYQFTTTGTFSDYASISIAYGADDLLSLYAAANLRIGQSATLTGTYNSIGPATGTTSPLVSATATYTSLGFFALGANENSVNLFNATVNNNWSNAANWSLGTVPTCSTLVAIPASKTCNVDINTAVANNMTIAGTLTIDATSNLTVSKCAANTNDAAFSLVSGGTLNVTGGQLTVNGRFEVGVGSFFNQSGGAISVDGSGSVASVPAGNVVQLSAAGTNYNLSGGTFTIVDPNSVFGQQTFAYSGTGIVVCTGTHTVIFGDGVSTQAGIPTFGFTISNIGPSFNFRNLTINGGTGTDRYVLLGGSNSVLGTMTINANSEYRQPFTTLYLAGDLINNGTFVNGNLRFESFATGTAAAVTTAQTVSGSGIFANSTGTSTGSANVLTVNNTSTAGVTFNVPFIVTGTFTHVAGIVNMGSNLLTIGTSTTVPGTWTHTSGRIVGNVKKWFGSNPGTAPIVFPVGTATNNQNATLTFSGALTAGGSIQAAFKTGLPSGANLTAANPQTINGQAINNISPTGYWQIDAADGLTLGTATYDVSFDASNFTMVGGTPISSTTDLRLLKRSTAATDWTDASATATTTSPTSLATLAMAGQTSFSIFALGAINNALPITLKSFSATEKGTVNVVNWETAMEQNVREFMIEKSQNGTTWTAMGTIMPNIQKRYTMMDNNPFATTYYRLKNIDNDGRTDVSNMVVVERKTDKFNITSVAPNPTASDLTVKFETTENTDVTIRVLDLFGRVVLSQQVNAAKGFNAAVINTQHLAAGAYFLNVNDGVTTLTQRIVKD